MAEIDDNNIVKIIEDGLRAQLKDAVVDKLANQMIEEFKSRAEEIVKDQVEKICFDGISRIEDHARMARSIQVYVKWNDEKAKLIEEGN